MRAAIAASLMLLLLLAATPARADVGDDPLYGVSASSPPRAGDVAAMGEGGVQAVRLEISWKGTGTGGGGFDWGPTDAVFEAAAEHGIEVVPYLTGRPKWAKRCKQGACPSTTSLDSSSDGWLRFVASAVARYGRGGELWPTATRSGEVTLPATTWQIWNTANNGIHPHAYRRLLEPTFRTIKLADPGAEVVTGAISYGARDSRPKAFLKKLLGTGNERVFSSVAVSPLSRSVAEVRAQLGEIRDVLDDADRRTDGIWVTPIGWASDRRSSRAASVGLQGQRSRLERSMPALREGLGIRGVIWARWRDGSRGCGWCRHSGLLTRSGEAKPAWDAYREFLESLRPDDPTDPDKPPPPPQPALPPTFFGVAPDGALTDRDYDLMEAARVGSARIIVNWQRVEISGGGAYDWSDLDRTFGQLALHGIQPVPQLFGTPEVVSDVDNVSAMSRWRAFVAAAVNRYKPGSPFWNRFKADNPGVAPKPLRVWEVYNEQNIWSFWPDGPSAKEYAKLLDISADAIRTADPTAQIMIGGMLGAGYMNGIHSWEFVRRLYEKFEAAEDIDIVASHPYGFPLEDAAWQIGKLHDVIAANDPSTEIWINEVGWGSVFDDNPAKDSWWERDPQGQADMLASLWNLLLANREAWNIQGVFWYTWRDPPATRSGLCDFCYSAGLLQNNYVPKPSFDAFRDIATTHGG